MKIAVYTICKDEEKHVDRFMESASEADYVVILDTGSQDASVPRLRELGAIVHEEVIDPWRFDTARNRCLDLVPDDVDVCLTVDLDETVSPGWADEIRRIWVPGNNRVNYWYLVEDGESYRHHKCHSRHGWHWVNCVHEELVGQEDNVAWAEFTVNHRPDHSKSRRQYRNMLRQHVRECPSDERGFLWLGIDYYNDGQYNEAIEACMDGCAINGGWSVNRSYMQSIAADCWENIPFGQEQRYTCLCDAIIEAPFHREAWYGLAKYLFETKSYSRLFQVCEHAVGITEKVSVSFNNPDAWGGDFYRWGGIAARNLGLNDEASRILHRGVLSCPDDKRLAKEYAYHLSKINPTSKS